MGLLSKLFGSSETPAKTSKQNIVKNGDWEVHIKEDGTPHLFYKSGREWFSALETWNSPNRSYFLHDGLDSKGDEYLALTTQTEGLRLKKFEDGVESALVTDDGIGYVISDEGVFYTITAEKSGQKSLAEDYPETCLLTADVAVAITDDGETATIKAVNLSTGKVWKKAVKHGEAEELQDGSLRMTQISEIAEGVEVITPDGVPHSFSVDGQPIKK